MRATPPSSHVHSPSEGDDVISENKLGMALGLRRELFVSV
jgi:hypothetical protein